MNQQAQFGSTQNFRSANSGQTVRATPPHASALWRVNPHEVAQLRAALARGQVPLDLRDKLTKLHQMGLIHHFVEQNSRLLLTLMLAVEDGSFRGMTSEERERLLRVLAYVRKDDDLIPDYQTGGFADDHHEVRAALHELGPLLEAFKLWRLRHQVPALWAKNPGHRQMHS